MKTDFIYLLKDGSVDSVFGNLKTLVESINSLKDYKIIGSSLRGSKNDEIFFNGYVIKRLPVVRAPYLKRA